LVALGKHVALFQALEDETLAVLAADPPVPTPMGEREKELIDYGHDVYRPLCDPQPQTSADQRVSPLIVSSRP
jgi:hypothetical protein